MKIDLNMVFWAVFPIDPDGWNVLIALLEQTL
jgi:hypothetical protein